MNTKKLFILTILNTWKVTKYFKFSILSLGIAMRILTYVALKQVNPKIGFNQNFV